MTPIPAPGPAMTGAAPVPSQTKPELATRDEHCPRRRQQ